MGLFLWAEPKYGYKPKVRQQIHMLLMKIIVKQPVLSGKSYLREDIQLSI